MAPAETASDVEIALAQQLAREFDRTRAALLHNSPTIVLLGPAGSGKSTLINKVFGVQLARISDGEHGTNAFDYYPAMEGRSLNLYDSKGMETLDRKYVASLREFIEERNKDAVKDPIRGIHCVWYFVNGAAARWTAGDAELVSEILKGIPTMIVVNKCDLMTVQQKQALAQVIKSANIANVKGVHFTAANPKPTGRCPTHGNDVMTNEARGVWMCGECSERGNLSVQFVGLDDLCDNTAFQMPELVRTAFLSVQAARLSLKQKQAAAIVISHALVSYGIGWAPIPGSDAPLLVGVQLAMAAELATLFGILKSAILPVVGGQIATFGLGLGLASLLKLIPGVGTIVGGLIDSSIAITFTLAIGCLYTAIFSVVYSEVSAATAEEKAHAFLKILQATDIRNVLNIIKELFGKVPKSRAQLELAFPSIASEVESMLEGEVQRCLTDLHEKNVA